MARRKKFPPLPAAGAAFAVPLADGRYSACRVLLDAASQESKNREGAILVAGSAWVGENVPTPDDPALRAILRLNHHSWRNEANLLWVTDLPPEEFLPIGDIPPTVIEQAMPCQSFGGWSTFEFQPLAQWKWDHDREAVLAEDAQKKQQQSEAGVKAQQARRDDLARITLEQLRDHRFFARWKEHPSSKAIRASRAIMADTVGKLLELGPHASEPARLAVLRQCIESFNDLDAESQFIHTVEREDVCEEFDAIVHACGLGARQDLADEWRDW